MDFIVTAGSTPVVARLAAVLPLKTFGRHYLSNLARCDILFASLRTYAAPGLFSTILVVVPSRELKRVEKSLSCWSDLPLTIVAEDEFLPVFHQYRRTSGWFRQQLIKLYAANVIDTEFYLTLDPDVILCKPLSAEQILIDGKAILEPEPRAVHAEWWRGSAQLLHLNADLTVPGMSVTPAILARRVCKQLFDHVQILYHSDWAVTLLKNINLNWTEYTLYHLVAEHYGLLDQLHAVPPARHARLLCASNVWAAGDDWDAGSCFGCNDPGLFAVVQSHAGICPTELIAMLPAALRVDHKRTITPAQRLRSVGEDIMRKTIGYI